MNIRLLTVGVCLTALSTGALATETKTWSDGGIPVIEFIQDDGSRFCGLMLVDGTGKTFGISKYDDGSMTLTFFSIHKNGVTWTSGGTVALTIDSTPYTVKTTLSADHASLRAPLGQSGPGLDFLHDFYNGSVLTIAAGNLYQTSFSLTGSATAIAILRRCGDAIITAGGFRPAVPPSAQQSQQSGRVYEAALTRRYGVTHVDGVINGVGVRFLLDSGAGDIAIPLGLAKRLATSGTLTKADYIGPGTYVMADGREHVKPRYRLSSVSVGGYTLTNVDCSIGEDGTDILLGQSFLGRLGSWSIDNARGVLVIN